MAGEIPPPTAPPRFAIASKGFRPFFLLGSLFAIAIVPMWLLVLSNVLRPGAYVDATTWHAHEMVFGFSTAVIAGFLLTAVGNCTPFGAKKPCPAERRLVKPFQRSNADRRGLKNVPYRL